MLRTGVLEGRTIAMWGAGDPSLAGRLEHLGAVTRAVVTGGALVAGEGIAPHPEAGRVDVLVADAGTVFAAAGGGYEGIRSAVDGAFAATRDCALATWIDRPGSGQVVLVAPAPGAGAHAGAARAALENLARTLSTEWARHAVTVVAVLPGDATRAAELADLVAWLASPAGAYVSGTALTLGPLG